ncbi:MAG: type I glutamate--ammonia ligase [Candidatus Gastranaerophilaceae bacterium]|jgi:glutamine synthetase|nr:type I glutamate--ammonia ligase [bacterium]MEE0496477.1 type I glutamate--ammonia ligase [Cyanobacteriota bacterium]CDE92677.1 glutamine synthetase [Fusobacterium sp. CAG:815]DAA89871.1 MAG TPA: type I glutamate--ammonia ligase [Candidatus Gastranaerophilales bacterium HUM_7]DAA93435.1 MAG TPA: type I glutamate--ammonia ligase [Candidatus Gastranaerophilales bacterium HUM_6]DAB03241.1 MAG TPA: type I glutamate--ammonia ligase [Candidatus Gastranaerophilales bacterium HUM_12]DAB05416.1 MAG
MTEFKHVRLDGKQFTREEIKSLIKEYNIKFIKLQFVDINGQVKNMSVPSEQIDKALNNEIMLDGSSIKGFRSIETSDMFFHPDINSFQILPWRNTNGINAARLICDIYNSDGTPFEGCPRCNLKRVMEAAEKLGFSMNVGPEAEFFLFSKDKDGNVTTDTQDSAGYYDVGPEDLGEDVRSDIVLTLQEMGFDIEASHHEVADGQHEIDFRYADILTAADNVTTFRIAVKAIAAQHNLHATFMPKPIFGINGSGMHCNVSLFKDGKNAFYDEKAEYQLSDTAKYAVGGILKHVKSITAITNPVVNSYKRLVPGYEAPVYLAWSLANRSALVRVPAKRGISTRVELRSPDPSCNPYLAFAAILEAALDGIRNKIDPPAPVESNIYKLTTKERKKQRIDSLPGSLYEALELMDKSLVARAALGDHIFTEFMTAKNKEWDSYRTDVSKWELDRYLERY